MQAAPIVQSTPIVQASSTSAVSLVFPANTTAGNFIVVVVSHTVNAGGTLSMSDGTNTYAQTATKASGNLSAFIWRAKNIAGGATTIVVTASDLASSPDVTAYATEYSGVDIATTETAGAGNAATGTVMSTGSITVSQPSLIVTCFAFNKVLSAISAKFLRIGGFVNGNALGCIVGEDGVASATLTETVTVNASTTYVACIAAFTLAAAASGGTRRVAA